MTKESFKILGFKENPYISSTVELEDKLFNFTIRWNDYAECAFVSIYDVDMNPIVLGRALVNNLLIRTDRRLLPKDLRFVNSNGDNYEHELDNISQEFAFIYG